MKIKTIYEDSQICVIDKPSGIVVNKSDTTKGLETIQDWAEKEFNIKEDKENESDFYKRGGIVHRLDKETSGILILAKTQHAFDNIQKQFKDRLVKKTYIALAHGKVVPEDGEIAVPVGRLPWNRTQFGIIPGGRESKTLYKVLRNYFNDRENEILSLVELYPQSGRTHQIRVHLKYIGHPIFSDFLYAGRKTSKKDRLLLERVFLHAYKISFIHPDTEKEINLTSEIPDELQKLLENFQIKQL